MIQLSVSGGGGKDSMTFSSDCVKMKKQGREEGSYN